MKLILLVTLLTSIESDFDTKQKIIVSDADRQIRIAATINQKALAALYHELYDIYPYKALEEHYRRIMRLSTHNVRLQRGRQER